MNARPSHRPSTPPAGAALPWTRGEKLLLLGLGALALGLRLWGLGELRFIDDELSHQTFVSQPPSFFLRAFFVSPLLPVWFGLYRLWYGLTQQSDLAIRLFSVLWGVLAVPALYAAARRLAPAGAGPAAPRRPNLPLATVAALLLATSGFHLNFSQTVTPYAAMTLLGAGSLWAALALLQGGGRRVALAHGLLLLLAIYTHQAGLLLWGAELAVLLGLALWARFRRAGEETGAAWPRLRRLSVLHLLVMLPGAGVFWILAHQWQALRASGGVPYVPPVTLEGLLALLHDLWAYRSAWSWAWPLESLGLLAGLAAGGAALWRLLARRSEPQGPDGARALALGVWILPAAVCLLAGVLLTKDFIYAPRFFAMFLPAGLLLTAAAVDGARRRLCPPGIRRHLLGGGLTLALLLPQGGSLAFLHGPARAAENFPVDAICAHLRAEARPGDLAVVHHSYYMMFFEHYCPKPPPRYLGAVQEHFQLKPFGGLHDPTTRRSVQELAARVAGAPRVFLILTPATNAQWRDPKGLVRRFFAESWQRLSQRCFACDGGDPVQVELYRPRKEGDPEDAQLPRAEPRSYRWLLDEGRRLFGAGKLGRAEALLERALALRPGAAEALSELICLHCSAGRLERALKLYRRVPPGRVDLSDPCFAPLRGALAADVGPGGG